jgi:hypothetical protein
LKIVAEVTNTGTEEVKVLKYHPRQSSPASVPPAFETTPARLLSLNQREFSVVKVTLIANPVSSVPSIVSPATVLPNISAVVRVTPSLRTILARSVPRDVFDAVAGENSSSRKCVMIQLLFNVESFLHQIELRVENVCDGNDITLVTLSPT